MKDLTFLHMLCCSVSIIQAFKACSIICYAILYLCTVIYILSIAVVGSRSVFIAAKFRLLTEEYFNK